MSENKPDNKEAAANAASEKWTEVEHLPEWDEEFYLVYTAKKHGKWVMLKTLRPEYVNDPEALEMIGREFDARYNLSHPNITMINDFEDVPGVGLSIITDDVYGDSLRKLIDKKAVTAHHIEQLRDRLPAALRYIQENHIAHHPLRPETIIFTENIGNLKLIDVGFEQRPCLTPHDAREDVEAYGRILSEALAATEHPDAHLKRVAERCKPTSHHRLRDLHELDMALNNRSNERIYVAVIAFLAIMIGFLLFLNSAGRPEVPVTLQHEGVPSVEQTVNNQ